MSATKLSLSAASSTSKLKLNTSKSRITIDVNSSFDTGHGENINDAKLDYMGQRLATASSDMTVRIFSVNRESGAYHKLAELTGYKGPVWEVAWSHPKFGNLLASASYDCRIIIWKEENESSNYTGKSRWSVIWDEQAHSCSVNSVSWCSPQFGAILAAGSSDGSISVLSLTKSNKWILSKIAKTHELGCQTVSWSPNAKRIASGGNDCSVKIWSFNDEGEGEGEWIIESTLRGHSDWVHSVEWSPSAEFVVSTGRDGKVLVWNKVEVPEEPKWNHSSVSINMSQYEDDDSENWNMKILQTFDKGCSASANWDPMGHFLCITDDKSEVYLWKHCAGNTWKCVAKPAIKEVKKSKRVSYGEGVK